MPTLGIFKNLIFYIVMYDLTERDHVHIANSKNGKKTKTAKIWLDNLEVHEKGSLSAKEIKDALNYVAENKAEFVKKIKVLRKNNKKNNR